MQNDHSGSILSSYRDERYQLVERLSTDLRNDPGVAACWLIGSLGRGEADALSEFDLRVVLQDHCISQVRKNPLAYGSRISEPIDEFEAPQNAPVGGAYCMAYYDAPTALISWMGIGSRNHWLSFLLELGCYSIELVYQNQTWRCNL